MQLLIKDSSGFDVVVEPGTTGDHAIFKFDHETDFFHVRREVLYEVLRALEVIG